MGKMWEANALLTMNYIDLKVSLNRRHVNIVVITDT